MYRRAMMEQEARENENFVTKLGNLPVVNLAWTQACTMYQKTKDRNGLLRATCNMAEGGVQIVVTTTKPLVDRYQPQIEKVNAYACEKLDEIEERYPITRRPTDQLWHEGLEKCSLALTPVYAVKTGYTNAINKGYETIESTKEYGMLKMNHTLETPLAKFAVEQVNNALTVSEEYVEKYLPPSDEETRENANVEVDEVSTLTRVVSLSGKVRRRVYKRALIDLKGLQVRSKEKMEKMNFTIDLIQYAKSSATDMKDTVEEKYELVQQKVSDYWEEINKEEDGELDKNQTLEQKTLYVARRMTKQIKTGLHTVSGYIPTHLQPTAVRHRMENAIQFTGQLYQSFKEAKGFDELPSWILTQAKTKMEYVTETITFLTGLFVLTPISFLERRPIHYGSQPETIEMEPVHMAVHNSNPREE